MKIDMPVDDVADDAMAAYREVTGRTETAPAPEPQPVEKAPSVAKAEPAAPVERKRSYEEEAGSDEASRKMYPGRTADGKFAKKEVAPDGGNNEETGSKPVDAAKAAAPKAETQPEPVAAPPAVASGPPPSWSVKAKAAWDKLPDDIKAEVNKREQEASSGLAALRDYKDLKPWADMAKSNGTTINKALENYVGMENLLKSDAVRGFTQIAKNCGYNQQQAASLFADLARRMGGDVGASTHSTQAPQPTIQNPNSDPLIEALRPVMAPILDRINAFEGKFTAQQQAQIDAHQRAQQAQREEGLSKALQTFAADPANRFYPDLEETMTQLFEKGMVPLTGNHAADLKAAYETAARLNPDVHEALIEQRLAEKQAAERKKEQEAADKARFASRSVSGSRLPGMQIKEREEDNGHDDIEADVRRAYRASMRS